MFSRKSDYEYAIEYYKKLELTERIDFHLEIFNQMDFQDRRKYYQQMVNVLNENNKVQFLSTVWDQIPRERLPITQLPPL